MRRYFQLQSRRQRGAHHSGHGIACPGYIKYFLRIGWNMYRLSVRDEADALLRTGDHQRVEPEPLANRRPQRHDVFIFVADSHMTDFTEFLHIGGNQKRAFIFLPLIAFGVNHQRNPAFTTGLYYFSA